MSFGDALRAHRLAAGLTQEQLAARAELSVRAVSDLERGPHRQPRLSTVELLADALELDSAARSGLRSAARPLLTAGASIGPDTSGSGRPPTSPPFPRPRSPLIGRDAELSDLTALLDASELRLLTVTGTGGVGKTSLALAAARASTREAVYVDLAVLDHPDHVLSALARAFGVEDDGPGTTAERLATALRDRRAIALLDTMEHLLGARAALLELLELTDALTLLVTSRRPLRVHGEHDLRLDPLRLPGPTDPEPAAAPALRLLIQRAEAAGASLLPGDEAELAAICRRLGGVPLALELAAARLVLRTPADLLAELRHILPALVVGPVGPADLPSRQRSMRSAIEWSVRLLSPPGRQLLRRLSVFSGGASVASIEMVTGAGPEVIGEVIDANLVLIERHGRTLRATFPVAVRELAREELRAAGEEDATIRAHARHLLSQLKAGPDAFDPDELPNLLAAVTGAAKIGEVGTALRLASAGGPIWVRHGWLVEAQQAIETVLELPGALEEAPGDVIGAMNSALELAAARWDASTGARWAEAAVGRARDTGDERLLARALVARGRAHRNRDGFVDAECDHAEAQDLARSTGDEELRLMALRLRSYAAGYGGDRPRAFALAQQLLDGARAAGVRREEGEALLLMAWTSLYNRARSPLPVVIEHLDAAALIFEELDEVSRVATARRIKGRALADAGRHHQARELLDQARDQFRRRGEAHACALTEILLSRSLLCLGALEEARTTADAVYAWARRHEDRWVMAVAAIALAHADIACGELGRARALCQEAGRTVIAAEDPLHGTWLLEARTTIAGVGGDQEQTRHLLLEADALRDTRDLHVSAYHPEAWDRVRAVAAGS